MSNADGPRQQILLVEDDAIVALSEREMLVRHGFDVEVAHCGASAVSAALRARGPDLVLMDVHLGDGMDGTQAARRILEARDLPIVFLTSHSEQEMVMRARDITNHGYVLKSSGEFVVLESIAMALRLHGAHRKLQQQTAHYRTLFELEADAVLLVDSRESRIIEANQAAAELYGYTQRELSDLTMYDLIAPEVRPARPAGDEEVRASRQYHRTRSGAELIVDVSERLVHLGVRPARIITVSDMTEHVRHEIAYRQMIHSSVDGVWVIDAQGVILEANAAITRILGYPRDEMVGHHLSEFEALESEQEVREHIRRKAAVGYDQFESKHRRKDGSIIDVGVSVSELGEPKDRYVAFIRDITTLVRDTAVARAKNDLQRYSEDHSATELIQALLDEAELLTQSAAAFLCFVDKNCTPVSPWSWSTNAIACHAGPGETPGAIPPDGPCPVEECARSGHSIIANEANAFPGRSLLVPVLQTGETRAVVGTCGKATKYAQNDASTVAELAQSVWEMLERRRAEDALNAALLAKDDLMVELNHRVKNNLLLVESLVILKDESLGELADLSDLSAQIASVRRIHERLSTGSGDLTIEMRSYLNDIVTMLLSAVHGHRVRELVRIDPLTLPAKLAVPLGLLVNELVTNAIKHGFRGDRCDHLRVELRARSGVGLTLTVANTGHPFAAGINTEQSETLGLKLVRALAEQLSGSLTLEKGVETCFVVTIPESVYTPGSPNSR